MKIWKKAIVPVVLSSMLLFTACGTTDVKQQSATGGKPQAGSEPIKVGAVFSMTGANSPLGVPEKQAVELLVKEINAGGGVVGRPLEVIFEDDKSDNTAAATAIKKLVTTDKVVAVLGSSGSGPSLGMVQYASSVNIPLISMAAANQITDPVRTGIFKTPHTDIHGTKRVYQYLKEKGMSKVAVLYDSNSYGSGWGEQLKKYAPEYGITIVASEQYGTKDTSMSTQLTKIKSSNADAIIVAGTNPAPATIAKEAKQLGITIPLISSHGSANAKFIELAGDAANGVLMVAEKLLVPEQIDAKDPQALVIKKFLDGYQKAYNALPDGFAGYGYDGLNILAEGIKLANGDFSKLAQSLEKVNYVGVTGHFQFSDKDHNGVNEDSMIMLEIKNGKFQVIK